MKVSKSRKTHISHFDIYAFITDYTGGMQMNNDYVIYYRFLRISPKRSFRFTLAKAEA